MPLEIWRTAMHALVRLVRFHTPSGIGTRFTLLGKTIAKREISLSHEEVKAFHLKATVSPRTWHAHDALC